MSQTRKAIFQFAYQRSADQDAATPVRHQVVVIGAGPVGLAVAIDLAQRDVPVLLVDDADRIGEGSRAICFAKRTLGIFDRLGVADGLVEKGVTWKTGRVFHRDHELYSFDLLPEGGHKMPAFINIQQYYVEAALVERAATFGAIDLRWNNRLSAIAPKTDHVRLTLDTPEGPYTILADWVIACDGARSPTRAMMGLDFEGAVFDERFLIADVKMSADFPTERWFWFEPPFHGGQSALLHKQPDDIWRIDLQLGRNADVAEETRPEVVTGRIQRMLGHSDFSLEWVSVYSFQCRRLERFVHDRVIFAGDSAHQVSPFGARGANSGIQDAENLAWKLAAVMKGQAPRALLDTYDAERGAAADENILNSTRATDFIAPPSPGEMALRNAALALAGRTAFAKRFVNSGRLSTPSTYETPLSTPDTAPWAGSAQLGATIPDAPVTTVEGQSTHLSAVLDGQFTILAMPGPHASHKIEGARLLVFGEHLFDMQDLFKTRFDATAGATYLIRPDGHLAARWRSFDPAGIKAAMNRAMGGMEP